MRTIVFATAGAVWLFITGVSVAQDIVPADRVSSSDESFLDTSWQESAGYVDSSRSGACVEVHPGNCFGVLPSDHCFDKFTSPLSNPFFFEDPRSLTEVRGIFLDNNLPDELMGGDAEVWAAQVRLRLSERWSVISPRLGYLQTHQPIGSSEGYLSSPVGLKYNFVRNVERQ